MWPQQVHLAMRSAPRVEQPPYRRSQGTKAVKGQNQNFRSLLRQWQYRSPEYTSGPDGRPSQTTIEQQRHLWSAKTRHRPRGMPVPGLSLEGGADRRCLTAQREILQENHLWFLHHLEIQISFCHLSYKYHPQHGNHCRCGRRYYRRHAPAHSRRRACTRRTGGCYQRPRCHPPISTRQRAASRSLARRAP